MSAQVQQLLRATWQNPVFGSAFPPSTQHPGAIAQVVGQMQAIGSIVIPKLGGYVSQGMSDVPPEVVQRIVAAEILPKTLAFCPALTIGEVDDIERLAAVSTAVGLMYWGDQTTDRGDMAMAEAITLLKKPAAQPTSSTVKARLHALRHIEEQVRQFAQPEDVPYALACFYDQVLLNEVHTVHLSHDYLASGKDPAFIAQHARELAETSTISAGFPSIASSLHAIYKQHNASLPSLAEIYATPTLTNLLQVCNVVVRLWDDMGDWQMDRGDNLAVGDFVINPFNEYDPAFVGRFCELGFVSEARTVGLQQHMQAFHDNEAGRKEHLSYVLTTLSDHLREYVSTAASTLSPKFDTYIKLCERVATIGFVNHIGDTAMMESVAANKKSA